MLTRRGFFGRSAGALAGAGMLASVNPAQAARELENKTDTANSGPRPAPGKIALEEHFLFPETADVSFGTTGPAEFRRQLEEIGPGRITEMDRGGVELSILSLVSTGIQAIPDASKATGIALRANDYLAQQISKNPNRLKGFAALPMQDPQAAARELTRCIKELGFCGALVNGFTQMDDRGTIAFYDSPQYRPFWATVQELDVPFYLHPRSPLPGHQPAYEGHPWLTGSVWGFTAETSIHALRLMGSGLFDEYTKVKVILGHLGEGIPCNIWRIDNRVARTFTGHPKAKRPIGDYLRQNFYITTSGNFRTQTLTEVILEVGADRILYSVDYPFEDTAVAAGWFDHAAISEQDREKIGRENARQLFRL